MKIDVVGASKTLLRSTSLSTHSAHTWLFMKGQLKGDIMALCYNRGRLRPGLSENGCSCHTECDNV